MRNQRSRVRVSERAIFAMMGWVCGMALGLLLYFTWKADEFLLTILPLAGVVFALWYGERTGKILTAEDTNRPISLFGQDRSTKKH
jgi:hypothetical protein